jgi:hypothetical protein
LRAKHSRESRLHKKEDVMDSLAAPLRLISRSMRGCGAWLLWLRVPLVRRAVVRIRERAPRFYNALAKSQLLRRIYMRIIRSGLAVSSASHVVGQPKPLNVVAGKPHSGGIFTSPQHGSGISTQSEIVNAMAHWSKGKRLHG